MAYNPDIDYKQLHLEWIQMNPCFKTEYNRSLYNSYYDEMYACYYSSEAVFKQNRTAWLLLGDDVKKKNSRQNVIKRVNQLYGIEQTLPSFFVTFNFDETLFTPELAMKGVKALLDKTYVESAYGVFEYYGKEKNHPHLHIRLTMNKYNTFGKLKDKLKQTTLVTKLTGGINFVDIKPYIEARHKEYLECDKALEKTEQIEKDKVWRENNGLPHYISKSL